MPVLRMREGDCGPRSRFLNELVPRLFPWRLALPRSLVILAVIAVLALVAGFLAFGGGNMGN